jgi:hypothetical protein
MSNNQSQRAKTNESTMDIKHVSACVWNFFFSFFLLFSFQQVATESKYGIYVSSFDAKEKNKF